MNTLLHTIVAGILSIGSFLGIYHAHVTVANPAPSFGAYNPTGGGTYRLLSSVGSSDTSITLSSFKEPVSNIAYTMTYLNSSIEYATLEPQSSTKEFISFTGITQNSDGSATLTGVTRGLGFSYPYTASTTLQQAHPAQSILILSNPPQLTNQYVNKNNAETITGTLSGPEPTASSNYATKNYVDTHVNGGTVSTDHVSVAGTAGETFYAGQVVYLNKSDARWYKAGTAIVGATTDALIGIAEGAGSAGNSISGGVTLHGMDTTNIGLTPGANYFASATAGATTTSTTTIAVGKAYSSTQLYVDPYFYTTRYFGPGYTLPPTQTASTTVLATDANGVLNWISVDSILPGISFTPQTVTGTTASTTIFQMTIPANTLGLKNVLKVSLPGSFIYTQGGNTNNWIDIGFGTASTTINLATLTGGAGNTIAKDITVYIQGNGTGSQNLAVTFDTATSSVTTTGSTATFSQDSTLAKSLTIIHRSDNGGGAGFKTTMEITQVLRQ